MVASRLSNFSGTKKYICVEFPVGKASNFAPVVGDDKALLASITMFHLPSLKYGMLAEHISESSAIAIPLANAFPR
jgi:hypothetical protein